MFWSLVMRAINSLFNKFSFTFIQPSYSATNIPAWTFLLNRLFVKLIKEFKSLPLISFHVPTRRKQLCFSDRKALLLTRDIVLSHQKTLVWHWYCFLQCNVTDENQLPSLYLGSSLKWVQRLIEWQTSLGHGIKIWWK